MTCDGQLGGFEVGLALFHLHLFGTLVVVLVEHVLPHIHQVTHNLLGYVLGQVVRD